MSFDHENCDACGRPILMSEASRYIRSADQDIGMTVHTRCIAAHHARAIANRAADMFGLTPAATQALETVVKKYLEENS